MDQTYKVAIDNPKTFNASIAATLVYRNRKIICTCTNTTKSNPFQKKFSRHQDAIFLHAENSCIVSALRKGIGINQFQDCSLYVAKASESQDKKTFYPSLSKPCIGCQRSIFQFGIGRIYFSTLSGVEEL